MRAFALLFLQLAGCISQPSANAEDSRWASFAEQEVRIRLNHPYAAKVRTTHVTREPNGHVAVCGWLNAKSDTDPTGWTGDQRFVWRHVPVFEQERPKSEMDAWWKTNCTAKPRDIAGGVSSVGVAARGFLASAR